MSAPVEADVLTEVPSTLKRLIRFISRGFYGIEHSLVIDMLVHHPCVKEDDLLELLKLDRKQLRSLINTLRNDKFIKVRMRVETDIGGKTTRHNYYFINYSTFVNVVKYKLDHMRRKIETEERDSTSRASFKCPLCEKSFTDLEADQLYDPVTNTMKCTFCQTEVSEEASSLPAQDARTLMVKFNEQLEPIFALLREVEDVKLAPEILEPEPMDIKHARPSGDKRERNTGVWSGESTRNIDYYNSENTITISMGGDNQAQEATKRPKKEQPVWMRESTIDGANSEPLHKPEVMGHPAASVPEHLSRGVESDDIMRTLLAHEKKSASTPVIPGAVGGAAGSDEDSSTSESEDEAPKPPVSVEVPKFTIGGPVEEMESDDDEDAVTMVTVGGHLVPYNDITEDMVERMTPAEKEEYIRIGQEMYMDMYE